MRDTVSETLTLRGDGRAELETNNGTASGTWLPAGTTVVLKMSSGGGFPLSGYSRRANRLRSQVETLGDLTLNGDGQRLVPLAKPEPRSDGSNFGVVWERLAE